jgi:hypothetical protein
MIVSSRTIASAVYTLCYFFMCPLMASECPEKDYYEMVPANDVLIAKIAECAPGLCIGDVVNQLPDRRCALFCGSLVSLSSGITLLIVQNLYIYGKSSCGLFASWPCALGNLALTGLGICLMTGPFALNHIKWALARLNILPESDLVILVEKRGNDELLSDEELRVNGSCLVKIMPNAFYKLSKHQARVLLESAKGFREWLADCSPECQ